MSYQIPSDEHITEALKKVLTDYRTISTQNKLQELVKNELKTTKQEFGVSGHRLRFLALQSGLVDLEIHTREGDPHKALTKCPVCGDILKRVKNLTIWGGEVTIEFSCPSCRYWTGKKKRIPTRYVFHLKK